MLSVIPTGPKQFPPKEAATGADPDLPRASQASGSTVPSHSSAGPWEQVSQPLAPTAPPSRADPAGILPHSHVRLTDRALCQHLRHNYGRTCWKLRENVWDLFYFGGEGERQERDWKAFKQSRPLTKQDLKLCTIFHIIQGWIACMCY